MRCMVFQLYIDPLVWAERDQTGTDIELALCESSVLVWETYVTADDFEQLLSFDYTNKMMANV